MSKQDSILKEAGELLESAQKEVLREINNKQGFLSRMFSKNNGESLKQAQSAISRAINQMRSFTKDESSLIVKLQNHLNEKSKIVKEMEERFAESEKETSTLKDRMRLYEAELNKLKEKELISPELAVVPAENHRLEEEFQTKIKELEGANREIQMVVKASKEELGNARQLNVEFANRLKRLKAEITNN
jgi:chromosome segregation ATPase